MMHCFTFPKLSLKKDWSNNSSSRGSVLCGFCCCWWCTVVISAVPNQACCHWTSLVWFVWHSFCGCGSNMYLESLKEGKPKFNFLVMISKSMFGANMSLFITKRTPNLLRSMVGASRLFFFNWICGLDQNGGNDNLFQRPVKVSTKHSSPCLERKKKRSEKAS